MSRGRDLLSLRGRPDDAIGRFSSPDVGYRFTWGVDRFDAIADGTDGTALVVL
ncbi:MAG: hypothetical protein ACRCZD_20880 [Phycicoccus sp.]